MKSAAKCCLAPMLASPKAPVQDSCRTRRMASSQSRLFVNSLRAPAVRSALRTTRRFDAVIKTTVRGDRNLISKVVVKNVNAINVLVDVEDLLGADEIVVKNVEVQAINGGINPMAFAYAIKATVEAGSNPCMASNTKIELVQTKIGPVLYVAAVRKTLTPNLVCTMEYAPVFKTVETEVRAMSDAVTDVLVKNVDERGNSKSIDELLGHG